MVDTQGSLTVLASGMLASQSYPAKAIFSPYRQIVAYSFGDKMIRLRNFEEHTDVYTLSHRERINDFFFTDDQRFLVVKTTANLVRIWDIKTHPVAQLRVKWPGYACFVPGSGVHMLTSDDNGAWHCNTPDSRCPEWLSGAVRYAVPWGDTAVLVLIRDTLCRINIQKGHREMVATLKGKIPDLPPVIGGNRIAVYREDTVVQVIRSDGITLAHMPAGNKINAMALSADGRWLALALDDSCAVVKMLPDSRTDTFYFNSPVTALAFAPNGQSLLIGCNGKAHRWTTKEKRPTPFLLNQQEEDSPTNAIAWSPDGRFIATGSGDRNIVLWNAQGRWLHSWVIPETYGSAQRLQFSSDGRFLLSQQYKKAVFGWPLDPKDLSKKMEAAQFLSPEERHVYNLK